MKLKAYLQKNKITYAEFAALVKVKPIAVYTWVRSDKDKRKLPRPSTLRIIQRVTNGQVQPADFFK
jgi:hypothetical protein